MTGFLIKDFKLMTRQKATLAMILLIIVLFPSFAMEPGFIVTYAMILLLFISVSTVSYDDFDNGMAFLFVLPVDRKTYVSEKYVLGILAGAVGWLVGTLVNVGYMALFGGESAETIARVGLSLVAIFPGTILMWEIILPLQLKFGAEKSRIVIFIVSGVVAAVAAIGTKLAAQNEEQANKIVNFVAETVVGLSPALLVLALFAVAFIGLLISYACSVKIMEKKEY